MLQYPDGTSRGETTTLAYDLERRHRERSVIPDDKAVAFVCDLKALPALRPGFEKGAFMSTEIRTYRISIGDDVLGNLNSRPRNTRWPEAELVVDRSDRAWWLRRGSRRQRRRGR